MSTVIDGTPATAWCPNCGDTHANAGGKCTRCGAVAMVAHTQDKIDTERYRLNGAKVVAAPASHPPVQLPRTAAVERWLAQTQALIEGLKKSQRDAAQRARSASAEAARFDAAIKHLEAVIGAVGTPTVSGPRWATGYDACIDCGTTARKHLAKGRCSTCDSRHRAAAKQGEST